MAAHPITLDPDLHQRLERVAQREVRSPEFVVRDALEMYFHACGETTEAGVATAEPVALWDESDESIANREQRLARVDESLEHFRRTGLHVTWEEVDRWLSRLQAGENAPPPECHA